MSGTWNPGDRFQLATRGDRYDGVTGRVRSLFVSRPDHAHVTHDDGTITSWPIARLERPTNPSGGAVTSTPAPSGDTTPSLVVLDAEKAVVAAALAWDEKPSPDTGLDLREAVREYREVSR